MKDFTLDIFSILLSEIIREDYIFLTLKEYFLDVNQSSKIVILRHDVDKLPNNSLAVAKIESSLGVRSTYYFRTVPMSYNEKIIREIADMGHEIGYHYENMDTLNGNLDKAWDDFRMNLDKLRKLYPVKTICMHGSPLSKYDNKLLWEKYNYKEVGVIGEPYLDIDYNNMLYLTDTGRKWDGDEVSIRDKVNTSYKITVQTTFNLIDRIKDNKLPDQIMITTHPQRWTDNYLSWVYELILQNIKNMVKKSMNRK